MFDQAANTTYNNSLAFSPVSPPVSSATVSSATVASSTMASSTMASAGVAHAGEASAGAASPESVLPGEDYLFSHQITPNTRAGAQELETLAHSYLAALLRSDRDSAAHLIQTAVEVGIDVRDIYLHVFQPSQYEVGRLWEANEISVAQEHFCTAATQMIMTDLYPQIFSAARNGRAMVAACIGSERHEIGIRMVADFFEMDGWDTYYLGTGVEVDTIISTLRAENAELLALSATMPHSLDEAQHIIDIIRATPDLHKVTILVGGGGFRERPELWRAIGADGYAGDAQEALDALDMLIAHPA